MSFLRALLFFPIIATFIAGAAVVPNRYIVELSTEPVSTHVANDASLRSMSHRGALQSATARSHRSRIAAEQDTARQQIESQEGGQVLGHVDTLLNALFVRIPDAKAGNLKNIPGVLRVHKVYRMEHFLDQAAVIHKLPQAWSQVGIANAGLGIKIAVVDSGIDVGHPGFQDPSLPMPAGFPIVSDDVNLPFTNNKIIVARSYPDLLDSSEPDRTARDHSGHGTAVAMCAAGVQTTGPLATISGFAPKAYLGSYKIEGSPNVNGPSTDATVQAFEDATNDGMDIISLSSGIPLPLDFDQDPVIDSAENASAMGVIVVIAAGNEGSGSNTISSPASAPSAIAAGASRNNRTFLPRVSVDTLGSFSSLPGDKAIPATPVRAALADVAALDPTGLACSALPANSLSGKIAFILRGTCTFEVKLNNAAAAGAIAGLIYTSPDRAADRFAEGSATIPAQMVTNGDGVTIKNALAKQSLSATLDFTMYPASVNPNQIADFSSRGPGVDFAIKPDLVAVGEDIYTAAQSFDPLGDVYDPSGFALIDGTSFSAPITSGSAAVVKSFRPGLTAAQYRSLLIDNAATLTLPDGTVARVQQVGGGLLDVSAALNATATAVPPTLSFNAGSGDVSTLRTLMITNIGTAADTFRLTAVARDGGVVPQLSASSLTLQPGASASVRVTFAGSLLQAGQYEGAIHIQSSRTSVDTHVPYWYGVTGQGANLVDFSVLDATTGRAGSRIVDAFNFRILDASGIPLQLRPADIQVSVKQGDGTFVNLDRNLGIPGGVGVNVRLGATPGPNIFHVQVGDLGQDFTLTGR